MLRPPLPGPRPPLRPPKGSLLRLGPPLGPKLALRALPELGSPLGPKLALRALPELGSLAGLELGPPLGLGLELEPLPGPPGDAAHCCISQSPKKNHINT